MHHFRENLTENKRNNLVFQVGHSIFFIAIIRFVILSKFHVVLFYSRNYTVYTYTHTQYTVST